MGLIVHTHQIHSSLVLCGEWFRISNFVLQLIQQKHERFQF